MDSASERLGIYRDLADTYERLGQVSMRDRFMILAADSALEIGQAAEAERLRQRLLQASRYHMLRPYNSFAEATQSADVQTYLRDLRANYPLDVARQLLATLLSTGAVSNPSLQAPIAPYSTPQAIPLAQTPEVVPTCPMIPQTAPFVDIYGRQAPAPRPTWQPAIDPMEMTPAPPQSRPLAQPLPGRQQPRNNSQPQSASAQPAARAFPPVKSAVAYRGASDRREPTGGSWLTFLLVGIVIVAGLALVVFTFGRPFLPAGWRF